MKKKMNVVEVRAYFGNQRCYEIPNGFLVNRFGKYQPNLSFIIGSEFELNKEGKPVNPLAYASDNAITDSFNLNLDGEAEVMFGEFWRSKKGGACFKPQSPNKCKHLLVCVRWGGAFSRSRGQVSDYAQKAGALYFHSASSNGGGLGYDYWVLPVGYVRQYESEQPFRIDKALAAAYCKKHSDLQESRRQEADRLYKEKIAAEAAARQNREVIISRLKEIQAEYEQLCESEGRIAPSLNLREVDFRFDWGQYMLYSKENLKIVEAKLAEYVKKADEAKAEAQRQRQAQAEFAPRFELLQDRARAVGVEITTECSQYAVVKLSGSSKEEHPAYSFDGLELCETVVREAEKKAREEQEKLAKKDAEAAARAAGLPSDVRIWKRTGAGTGCSKGYVIRANGTERQRDDLYNEDSRRASRYDEGYEIWNQILADELVFQWGKACTAAKHELEVIYRPEAVTEAQLECVAELLAEINGEWEGRTGLRSGIPSPLIDIKAFINSLR